MITSPLVASALVDRPFAYQFETLNADLLEVANLPPALTFDSTLSAIVGLPNVTGVFSIDLRATNSFGTATATLTLTVQPIPKIGPVITSSTAATGRVGQFFYFHIITLGGSPDSRLSAENLPPGLSADPITGIISGTPTVEGSTAVTLTVVDGDLTTTGLFQITITNDPNRPTIISSDTASLPINEPFVYTIQTIPSSPGNVVYSVVGNLPAGLVFDPVAGTISGNYSPRPGQSGQSPDAVDLAGGALVASIQLFGTNSVGTGTLQLLFLAAPTGLVNLSTRMLVGTDDDVLIGGFIVTGNAPKVVITRALGPSLAGAGIVDALQDPVLDLHDGAHTPSVITNDDWRGAQQQLIQNSGIPPVDNRESAIIIALDPGNYTAILHGRGSSTGVAVVEVYDLGTASLDASGNSRLAQLSTRGKVLGGNNVMIGGIIISGSATPIIMRAIGPELNGIVPDALQDTVLELRDGSGSLIAANDDWRSTQEQEIINTGVPPSDDREAAIFATLNPGSYTGIVKGKNETTGAALVEVYGLQTGGSLKKSPR